MTLMSKNEKIYINSEIAEIGLTKNNNGNEYIRIKCVKGNFSNKVLKKEYGKSFIKLLKKENLTLTDDTNISNVFKKLEKTYEEYTPKNATPKRTKAKSPYFDKEGNFSPTLFKKWLYIPEEEVSILDKLDKCLEYGFYVPDFVLSSFFAMYYKIYLYLNLEKRYIKVEHGYEEINTFKACSLLSERFKSNVIFSEKNVKSALSTQNENIDKDYNLIYCKNGSINTETQEFSKDYPPSLPKVTLPYNYYVDDVNKCLDFENTNLYKEICEILKTDVEGFENNINNYFLLIANSLMSINLEEVIVLIHGNTDSRKSTLLHILNCLMQRNTSYVTLHQICENKDFDLMDLPDKVINIDDDVSRARITNQKTFNTFVTGNGFQIPRKYKDNYIMNEYNTPRFWGGCNTLPEITFDGFERRVAILLAENKFTNNKREYLQDFSMGRRDDELEAMFNYCLYLYFNHDGRILSKDAKKVMWSRYQSNSNFNQTLFEELFIPKDEFLKLLAEKGFEPVVQGHYCWISLNDDLQVNVPLFVKTPEALRIFKRGLEKAFNENRIYGESKISSKFLEVLFNNNGIPKEQPRIKEVKEKHKTLDDYSEDWENIKDTRPRAFVDVVYLDDELKSIIGV